jgi:hypothetical protein
MMINYFDKQGGKGIRYFDDLQRKWSNKFVSGRGKNYGRPLLCGDSSTKNIPES